jgi:hypothetical protein
MLLEYHLIDQFQFWIFPVRVGRGGACSKTSTARHRRSP